MTLVPGSLSSSNAVSRTLSVTLFSLPWKPVITKFYVYYSILTPAHLLNLTLNLDKQNAYLHKYNPTTHSLLFKPPPPTSANNPICAKSSPTPTSILLPIPHDPFIAIETHCKTCHIHILTKSFTVPNNNLSYSIFVDCKFSNLVYQLKSIKRNTFCIGETGQMLSKHMNGYQSTCATLNFDLLVVNPICLLFRNAGPAL